MRVLVADDEPQIASVLAELLSGAGHQVDVARDCPSARRRLDERPYDVVLSDLHMPEGGGRALYERLEVRGAAALPRFVFLVATTVVDADTDAFLDRTHAATIHKPFSLRQVRAKLEAPAGR